MIKKQSSPYSICQRQPAFLGNVQLHGKLGLSANRYGRFYAQKERRRILANGYFFIRKDRPEFSYNDYD
jgi:hypothetical protein